MKKQIFDYLDALAFGDEVTKEEAYDFLYQFVKNLNI